MATQLVIHPYENRKAIQLTSLFSLKDLSTGNSILPFFLLIFSIAFHPIFFSSSQHTPAQPDKVIWHRERTVCNLQYGVDLDL